MFQFKPKKALAVTYGSYDFTRQLKPYEFNYVLISWEASYNASKKVLHEKIQKVILLLEKQVIVILLF